MEYICYFGSLSGSVFEKKNLGLVWNEFGSVQFKKRHSDRIS